MGIHSAMPMARAVRLCPQLIIIPPQFDAYRAASRRVMGVLNDLTPFVEQISIDEAFLDVTMLRDDAEVIARRLQAQIRDSFGLPCSLGVATSTMKLTASSASVICFHQPPPPSMRSRSRQTPPRRVQRPDGRGGQRRTFRRPRGHRR
ncbi:MAG: hypothetical protein IPK17_11355 [Chloroflexi bacterium]|nr:hypothetical protein [Chloroflexota bacterium]